MRPIASISQSLAKGILIFLMLSSSLSIVNNYDYRAIPTNTFTAWTINLVEAKNAKGKVPMLRIKVHSNPNTGKFILKFDVPTARDLTLRITNKKGKEVFRQELKKFKGYYLEEIDISDQPEGKYSLLLDYLNRTQEKAIQIYK